MGKSLGGLKGVGGFMSRGIVGGAASSVQGGKFSHGFVSAGASSIGGNAGSPTGNILMSAMVGGTVSHLVGGKFANGAVSGALAQMLSMGQSHKVGISSTSSENLGSLAERTAAFNQKIEELYADKTLSGRYHRTHEAAAAEVLEAITPLSRDFGLEASGNIIERKLDSGNTVYKYSRPVVGLPDRASVAGHSIGYHTHPSGDLLFSNEFQRSLGKPADTHWVRQNRQHLYLGVMEGSHVGVSICEFRSACMSDITPKGAPGRRIQ